MSSFSEATQMILKSSGWNPERKVDPTPWITMLEKANYPVFESAVSVLEHLGGLEIVTTSFQEKPFMLANKQPMIMLSRSDPVFEFWPEKSSAISQASVWKSLHYLRVKSHLIAPIGIFRYLYSDPLDLFILNNGRVFGGSWYSLGKSRKRDNPGLFYLGQDIFDAINRVLGRFLAYW